MLSFFTLFFLSNHLFSTAWWCCELNVTFTKSRVTKFSYCQNWPKRWKGKRRYLNLLNHTICIPRKLAIVSVTFIKYRLVESLCHEIYILTLKHENGLTNDKEFCKRWYIWAQIVWNWELKRCNKKTFLKHSNECNNSISGETWWSKCPEQPSRTLIS